MSNIVLDASAILAIVNAEKGTTEAMNYLKQGIMSTINFSETVYCLSRVNLSFAEARFIIKGLVSDIILFDEDQAYLTAEFKITTQKFGFSLGDCACLALAKLRHLPVVTADQAWKEMDLGIKIIMIR